MREDEKGKKEKVKNCLCYYSGNLWPGIEQAGSVLTALIE